MRGISEKELKDRQDVARRIKDYVRSTLIDELISECKELPHQTGTYQAQSTDLRRLMRKYANE